MQAKQLIWRENKENIDLFVSSKNEITQSGFNRRVYQWKHHDNSASK